jgi:hypothetical protein
MIISRINFLFKVVFTLFVLIFHISFTITTSFLYEIFLSSHYYLPILIFLFPFFIQLFSNYSLNFFLFTQLFLHFIFNLAILQALWLNQNEPENWKKSKTICEKQDFINYRLSDNLCCSSTNCAARWNWNVEESCQTYSESDYYSGHKIDSINGKQEEETEIEIEKDFISLYPGRPVSLLHKIDLSDLLEKWPKNCVPMGGCVGRLTKGEYLLFVILFTSFYIMCICVSLTSCFVFSCILQYFVLFHIVLDG